MSKKLLLLLISFLSFNSFSQVKFEKGYYVDNSNHKINCLIKKLDWRSNPSYFEIKLTENDKAIIINIDTAKEFAVNNNIKYVRKSVKIDKSSVNINNLSHERNPIFNEKQLFLRVLVEGKANLYLFKDGNIERFFYNIDNSMIDQLVYKEYVKTIDYKDILNGEKDIIKKNNYFRQQLSNKLKCQAFNKNKTKFLRYKKNELINYFIGFNTCHHSETYNFDAKRRKKDLFNLTIRPRFIFSSLVIHKNSDYNYKKGILDFGNQKNLEWGVEIEFILPFNKNEWSVILELNTRKFNVEEKTFDADFVTYGKLTGSASYSIKEVPIGVRYYYFINENSKLFANFSYLFSSSNNPIYFERADNTFYKYLNPTYINDLCMGVGYNYHNRFSLEMRYYFISKGIFWIDSWSSDYRAFSAVLGFTVF